MYAEKLNRESFSPDKQIQRPRLEILQFVFTVEDGSEEEFGQWTTDELTGEQGYFDDEHSCLWTWDDNQSGGKTDHSRVVS